MLETRFPDALWGGFRMTFVPSGQPIPPEAPLYAALVMALTEDRRFVVADIVGRGWCVPGGRLESGESAEQAARREAWEEAGIRLGPLDLLGHFVRVDEAGGGRTLTPLFRGRVTQWEPLPPGTESRGVQTLSLAELPQQYYFWDALLEAVFRCALAEPYLPRR